MEKTLKLNLQADGKLTVVGQDESLGFQSETKATTLRITLPKNMASSIQHYVEFLAPSGDSKSSAQLEKHVDPSDNSDYIEVPLETPLIQEAGRYAVQYVGRDLTNAKCIKSAIIALEVDDSINAGNNMEDTNPDWIAWAENKLNNHEDRIAALENDEDAEVHSDGVGIRDGEIVVKDSTGSKKIKGSGKTLEEVHTQAVSAATQIAAADATQKASSAQTAAIAAASVDASQKATTAKSEAIAAAASDATSKAATAKSEAITAAGIDAAQKVEVEKGRAQQVESNHETRIGALEQDEHSEVKADANFGTDEIILVADGTGKKVKAGTKTIAQIQSEASSDATSKAAAAKSEAIAAASADATTKAATAKSEAITAAASDATTKAATAKSEAIAAASADATSKASAAQAAAEATASADATSKVATETARAQAAEATKQATLISGQNIKTINGESILGSGNLEIEGGSSQKIYGIRFTGNATNGVRLNNAEGLTFDLSQGINDFSLEELFAKIHEVETTAYNSAGQALVDSSGATLKNKFIYIPNFYFKQTLTQDASGNDVVSWYVTDKEKAGFIPVFKNANGTVPKAFLVGKYETAFGDDTEAVVGSFTGKKPVVNVNRDWVHARTTYALDSTLGINNLQIVDQSFPVKAWCAVTILITIITGTRHHQSVFYGITGDNLFNPADATNVDKQPTEAANWFAVPSTNYIRTKSEVGSKITIYSSSSVSRRWEEHEIEAIEDDLPETGYSKITFKGTAKIMNTGTVRIGLHCGELTGKTDSINGDFGNLATDNQHAFKALGVENFFGNFWTILGGGAIHAKWDATLSEPHNVLMTPTGDNYTVGTSYTAFQDTNTELALADGYVKRLSFKDSIFVPSITSGASSTTFYADYYYQAHRSSAGDSYYTFLGGGNYYVGANAGSFYFDCDAGWTVSGWYCGFRSFLLIQ